MTTLITSIKEMSKISTNFNKKQSVPRLCSNDGGFTRRSFRNDVTISKGK